MCSVSSPIGTSLRDTSMTRAELGWTEEVGGLWFTSALGEAGGLGSALSSRTLFMELMLPLSCTTSPSPTVTVCASLPGRPVTALTLTTWLPGSTSKEPVVPFLILPTFCPSMLTVHGRSIPWHLSGRSIKILAPPPGMLRPTLRRVLLDQGA